MHTRTHAQTTERWERQPRKQIPERAVAAAPFWTERLIETVTNNEPLLPNIQCLRSLFLVFSRALLGQPDPQKPA
eukprot:9832564-Alexandrium_andersonii.AAC.1